MKLSRKPFIVGNWKMYKNLNESISFIVDFCKKDIDYSKVDVLIAASFISIDALCKAIKQSNKLVYVASQNIFTKTEGAYTGEVSVEMVKSAGAKYSIIGHSERREYFYEDDLLLNEKIQIALLNGLNVILCVGEKEYERDASVFHEVVLSQLGKCLKNVTKNDISNVTIAYEPVWAIGTGKTASSEDAEDMHLKIRNKIASLYNTDVAESIRILYGGSVKPENIKQLMSKPNIDGALVGGASLDVEKFTSIVNFYK